MAVTDAGSLLGNVRVLDLTTSRAELAGQVLAQLGAEVFKVEPPGGSESRRIGPFEGDAEGDVERSLYWAAVGMGKTSVQLDIREPDGQRQLRDFVRRCDVLVESFDPGYLANLGLDYESLRAVNPSLIYASVTPYGQDGPDALSPASELTLEAAGGLLSLQGDGDRPPIPVGYPQAAFHAGAQAAADIVIALNERARSGLGQHLDVSTQACVVWTLMNATGYFPAQGIDPPGTCEGRAAAPPQLVPGVDVPAVWPCKDGYITASFALGAFGGRTLDGMIKWMASETKVPAEIAERSWDTWTLDALEGRIPGLVAQDAIGRVSEFLLTKTKQELQARAVAENLLLAPIYTPADLLVDPQLASRGFWAEVGGRKHPGPFAKLSRTPLQLRPAPRLDNAAPLPTEDRAPSSPPVSTAERGRAFAGLKVVDFAWVGVGPIVSKALADHGATVVHVESTLRPDILRSLPPFKDGVPGLNRSQFFGDYNTSKLGLSLNLASDEGRELAHRLVDWADVVVESFTPGTLDKMGLGWKDLSKGRPDLIMLSTCLRGQTGPERTYAGFGGQGAALSGLFSLTGWPDRPPKGPWGAYSDFIAPRYGTAVLAAAVLERRDSGLGQHIDLSQVEAATHFLEPYILDYTVNGRLRGPAGHESERASPHGVYGTKGAERYIALSVETPEQWEALRSVAPLAAFADEKYRDLRARLAVDSSIDTALADWLAVQDPWASAERLKRAGAPASVVLRPSDLYSDAQLAHRGFFVVRDHAEMGPTPYDGHATRFSATPGEFTAAPTLGQHTAQVLREVLGLTDEQIGEYAAAGALT